MANNAQQIGAAHQHYLLVARQIQAMSFTVHIPLVCFGIALPTMVLLAEALHLRTGREVYRSIARRWTRVMIALFAVGVVTGTILSFEMGLLWPAFTGRFGGVFGLGFAIEGFSFFAEAIFIGIYAYGWDRLSPRLHFLSGIPIALAGVTGSLMVIAVNGWMNHPAGFRLDHGRIVDVHPLTALFGNGYLWHEFVHMYIAAYIVAGFCIAGWYAFCHLRGRSTRYERTALAIALSFALVAAPVQLVVGDWAARDVARAEPVKLAALEGLGPTTRGASIHILGWYEDGSVKDGIAIPRALSLLAFHRPNAVVTGLESVPASDRPPVNVVRVAFQLMVVIGTLLAALAAWGLVARWRLGHLPRTLWWHRALVVSGPAACVALVAGWVTTEVGRQPWVVYGVLRTSQAVTGTPGLPIGYGTLAAAYAVLIAAVAWILLRLAARPLDDTQLEHAGATTVTEIG